MQASPSSQLVPSAASVSVQAPASHAATLQGPDTVHVPQEFPQASVPQTAVPQSAGAALPPPHTPAVQVSPTVQASPSSQLVPSAASVSVQVPSVHTATLQGSEAAHSASAVQLTPASAASTGPASSMTSSSVSVVVVSVEPASGSTSGPGSAGGVDGVHSMGLSPEGSTPVPPQSYQPWSATQPHSWPSSAQSAAYGPWSVQYITTVPSQQPIWAFTSSAQTSKAQVPSGVQASPAPHSPQEFPHSSVPQTLSPQEHAAHWPSAVQYWPSAHPVPQGSPHAKPHCFPSHVSAQVSPGHRYGRLMSAGAGSPWVPQSK